MYTKLLLIFLLSAKIDAVEIFDQIQWKVQNHNGSISIPAQVPGGIYSDLQAAGVIGDILFGFNDVLTRWVAKDVWTYEGNFTVGKELDHSVANLVLHGVDTVAFVEVNEHPVGSANNMFVRYVFNIKPQLKEGANTIKITFSPPIEAAEKRSMKHFAPPACVPDVYNGECHVNQLRKMQASFAWDWGPAFPSVGLWKPVAIEFYDRAIIRSVTTHIDKGQQHWYLKINTYLEANKNSQNWNGNIRAELTVEGHQKISISKDVETDVNQDGTAEVHLNLTIRENVIRPWWPNGYGEQPLYNLRVSISSAGETDYKEIQIGFRTVELVEEDAYEKVGNSSAGKGLTFYFKINGYPIFMKGSNWIPAHILPELGYKKETVDGILEAAVDSHMNMLRVWGGGVYESDLFYQRCDQLGILIWQDFLFACSMYPTDFEFIDIVKTEIEQNVKRLQYHPSIAVWAGNNENEVALRGNWYNTKPQFEKYKNEYITLYVNTIKPIVNNLDPRRRYLISSPSNGIESEKEGYIAVNPYDSHYGDTHYYNYIADNWNMNIYPPTRFASEYGFQSLPSILTTKSATNNSDDLRVGSDFSLHRQHSPTGYLAIDGQIQLNLKLEEDYPGPNVEYEYYKKFVLYSQSLPSTLTTKSATNNSDDLRVGSDFSLHRQHSPTGYLAIDGQIQLNLKLEEDYPRPNVEYEYYKKFVLYSQITQAMAMKAETEYYRQSQTDWYTMGALYWQLNDVWQAPSWSSMDFQRRWKMLQYFAQSFFAPVLVSPRLLPSGDVDVYLLNDRFVPIVDAQITIEVYNWSSLIPILSKQFKGNAKALSAEKQVIELDFWKAQNKSEIFLKFSLQAPGVESSPYNFVFPKKLKSVSGLKKPNIKISVARATVNENNYKYWIDIQVDAIVLFLWLETPPILHSYFQENGMIITTPYYRTTYVSTVNVTVADLQDMITYQYYYEK